MRCCRCSRKIVTTSDTPCDRPRRCLNDGEDELGELLREPVAGSLDGTVVTAIYSALDWPEFRDGAMIGDYKTLEEARLRDTGTCGRGSDDSTVSRVSGSVLRHSCIRRSMDRAGSTRSGRFSSAFRPAPYRRSRTGRHGQPLVLRGRWDSPQKDRRRRKAKRGCNRRLLDVAGKVVAPGFIDVHSHGDRGLASKDTRRRAAPNLVAQGVTTIVVNQDGRSPWPIRDQRATMETDGIGPNALLLIGHGTLRRKVMGDDFQRTATETEIRQMQDLMKQGMRRGHMASARGMSMPR